MARSRETKKGKTRTAPARGGPKHASRLQQFGNRAIGRLLAGLDRRSLEPALRGVPGMLDRPDHPSERTARTLARRHSAPVDGRPVRRSLRSNHFGPLAGTAFARHLSGGGGKPVAKTLRQPVEGAIDTDLGDARLHDGPAAGRLARSMRARAFTVGRDIYVDRRQADPRTRSGQEVLREELVHVGQNMGSPKAGRPGAVIQRATARTRMQGWDKVHDCYSDIINDGQPLEEPFRYGAIVVGADAEAQFGGHAWLGFEYFDLMEPETHMEWVYPNSIFTDLVWDAVRFETDQTGRQRIVNRMADKNHMGQVYPKVPVGNIKNALKKAKDIKGKYAGKLKKGQKAPKGKLHYETTGLGKHGINCALYVEEVLKAAGIEASAGKVVKTPEKVAGGVVKPRKKKKRAFS